MRLKVFAIVVLGVVGVSAAFLALGGLPSSAATTSQYLTSPATTGNVVDDVAASGTIAASESYGLAFGTTPYLAGTTTGGGSGTWTVTDVKVEVGDTVKAGDVLATADTTDLKRQLTEALQTWRVASIGETVAQEALDDASGTDAVRQAKSNLYNAQNQVSAALHTRRELAEQIALATLKTPIDGTVITVGIVKGLDAPSGDAIVIDSTGMQVTAEVVESDLAKIVVGQTAAVSIGAVSADVTGTVTSIAPTATSGGNSGVVSYATTIVLTDPPAAVRAGMTADVTIGVASANDVLTVPAAALRGSDGAYTVLVLDAAGQPVAQAVEVGLVTASTAEIKSGLTAGQEVVTGVNTAQNNQTVTSGNFGRGNFGGGVAVPITGGGRAPGQ